MKTAATNKKIREIVTMVKEGKLVPRPDFQRRLVWTREDKNLFLDSVIRGYPFPEIYLADGDVDLESGTGTSLLVDGLQRVNTLVQYFEGSNELKLTKVMPYRDLPEAQKKSFLQYDVSVRDLGSISKEEIIEVFQRLNATKYSLHDIEINNAVYAGAFKKFCEKVSELDFFKQHSIFNATDYKRMGDLRYAITVVGTMLLGYFNRDDEFDSLLKRSNDEFPEESEIMRRVETAMATIEEFGFDASCRVWKKADLFTILIEVDRLLNNPEPPREWQKSVESLVNFFSEVDSPSASDETARVYHKAAIQASNDKGNRVRRGIIISGLLEGKRRSTILQTLRKEKAI